MKPKLEHYKTGYQRLYGFLRARHPEVLKEYRVYLGEIKKRVEQAILALENPHGDVESEIQTKP